MFEKKEKILIWFYLIVIAFYILLASRAISFGSILRLTMLAVIFAPIIIMNKLDWLPATFTLFFSIFLTNYKSLLLPTNPQTYYIIILLCLAFTGFRKKQPIPWSLFVLIILPFFVNLLTEGKVEDITINFIMLAAFYFYMSVNGKKQFVIFSYVFIALAFILSISQTLFGDSIEVMMVGGYERLGLQDINYSACVIGMGVVSGMIILSTRSTGGPIMTALVILTIVLSMFTLASNASRASVLGVGMAIAVLLIFSKIGKLYKVVLITGIALLIVFMYNSSYFELLEYRIQNDVGGGSNRLIIWPAKLEAFFNDGNLTNYLFGYGFEQARHMGGTVADVAFHNDFLAIFCEYGILGLVAFLSLFITPLLKSSFKNAPTLAATLYLAIVCFTLEPFAAGRFTYLAFLFYIYILSDTINQEDYKI